MGSDVGRSVLLPAFPCQSANQEPALAAIPAGQAFTAASEMCAWCWLKLLNSVGKQERSQECSHLDEVIKGVIAHQRYSFVGSKLTNCKTEWLV